MDTLTHTVAGLFLARAGLGRWTPKALPILLLAANAPDLDVLSGLGGLPDYLNYHRGLTHSLAAAPLIAILPVLAVGLLSRVPMRRGAAFLASLIGVGSHLLLDWAGGYGFRPFLPFSASWVRPDLMFIVDIWIWAVFLLCLAAPFLSGLVSSEISSSARRKGVPGRGFAIGALVFLSVYTCGRGVLHARAIESLNSRMYRGLGPIRVAALPGPVNPLRWRVVVETTEFYAVGAIDLQGQFDPSRLSVFGKTPDQPAIAAARQAPAIRNFLRFADFPLWRVSPAGENGNERLVEVFDLRFGDPGRPGMRASAQTDSSGRVVKTTVNLGWRVPG